MNDTPLMLDVDTGVDDAAAIAYLLGLEANVLGISTLAGNVGVDDATENTLRVVALLGAETIPVFRGASRPLVASYQDATHVHGGNGLGGVELPESPMTEAEITAPEAILAMAEEFDGELVLIATGPLTNIAIAISLRPSIVHQVKSLVIMGGAYFTGGNVTPHAEFNIHTDPDAAAQVFAAKWNEIVAIGLDVTHQTAITRKMWEAIPEAADGAAGLVRDICARTFTERDKGGFFLHDPLAAAVALDQTLVTLMPCSIEVVTTGDERGKTIATEGGNVQVATEVNVETFLHRFCNAIEIPYLDDPEGAAAAE